MKLLICTQKIDKNDPILGFFHRWVEEFAKHCKQITVIALGVGKYDLPANVRVFSLGKERGVSRLGYISSFYRLIWRERRSYDTVFVHMNPVYVALGAPLWRARGKRIGLWYTHKRIDLKLLIAEKLVHDIFTASPESFRLKSGKIHSVGHGIDVEQWIPRPHMPHDTIEIITTGRISPVKDYETLLRAMVILMKKNLRVRLGIIGDIVKKEDTPYKERLWRMVHSQKLDDVVTFVGSVPNRLLPESIVHSDVFVNMSKTGSVDKAVLEAMACGVPVITSNEAFRNVLGGDAATLIVPQGDTRSLAECIETVTALSDMERAALAERLRNVIVEKHNLVRLVPRILSYYETSR